MNMPAWAMHIYKAAGESKKTECTMLVQRLRDGGKRFNCLKAAGYVASTSLARHLFKNPPDM